MIATQQHFLTEDDNPVWYKNVVSPTAKRKRTASEDGNDGFSTKKTQFYNENSLALHTHGQVDLLASLSPTTWVPLQHDESLDPQLFLPLPIHNPSHESGYSTMAATSDLGSSNAALNAPDTEHILRHSSLPHTMPQATASNNTLSETLISIEHTTGRQMQDTRVEQSLMGGGAHQDVVWTGLGRDIDVSEAWTNSDDG